MAPNRKEYSEDLRKRVITMNQDGFSMGKICETLHIPKASIQKMITKFNKEGTVANAPGRGRQRLTTKAEDRFIKRKIKKDRRESAVRLASELIDVLGKKISPQTIRNRLHEDGMHGRIARRKPFINARNRKKRLTWARKHRDVDSSFWEKVIWSDESKFNLFGSDGVVRVWRSPGEEFKSECINPTVKHGGGSVMVWGCFSANGVGKLVFIDGIMRKEDYLKILKDNLRQSVAMVNLGNEFIFQHDKDPKHTAKVVTEWLAENNIHVIEWVAQSPDMNPIEHLWEHLKRKIGNRKFSSASNLKAALQSEWVAIPPEVCQKLVNSMRNRCQECVKSKGGCTRY